MQYLKLVEYQKKGEDMKRWAIFFIGLFFSTSVLVFAGEQNSAAVTKIVFEEYQRLNYPAHFVSIYENGKIEFGELADHIEWVSADKVAELFKKFRDEDFFSITTDGQCEIYMTDQRYTSISLTKNGQTKKVYHYHGCENTDDPPIP